MERATDLEVRVATAADAEPVAALLCAFNAEFGEPAPPPPELAVRLRRLLGAGDTMVLVAGDARDGVAVLRFRDAIWTSGLECYLAELYVVPERRGRGLGRALLEAAIRLARERGAETMDVGVDEPDAVARRLYESLGFTNRTGGDDGAVMYVYERHL